MSQAFEYDLKIVDDIEKIFDQAKAEIDKKLHSLLRSGDYDLPVNPEMLRTCELSWVKHAIVEHQSPPHGLEHAKLMDLLNTKAENTERFEEPDAKALVALIGSGRLRLNERFNSIISNELHKTSKLLQEECHIIKNSHKELEEHAHKIIDKMTLGLDRGTEFKETWIGNYGEKRTSENTAPEDSWTHVGRRR